MVNVITLKNPISGSDFYVSGDDPQDYFWDIHCSDGSIRIDARPMWIAIPVLRRVLNAIPGGIWMYTDVALSFAEEKVEVVQAALELLLLGETSVPEAELLAEINRVMRALGVRNAALMAESRPQSSQTPTDSPPPISPRPQTWASARSPHPRFDVATEASQLAELGRSSLDERAVICGLCRLEFPLFTFESGHLTRQFRQAHFDACALNHAANATRLSVSQSEDDGSDADQASGDTTDELEAIVKEWTEARAQLTINSRRTWEEPDIDALRTELRALADSHFVAKGEKIQCGLCRKALVVSGARRSLQGKIQYFKKKHYYPNHFPQIASSCSSVSVSGPGTTSSNPETIGQTLALALLFQCRRCDREFKSGWELKSHFQNECDRPETEPPGGPFQCHLCPQAVFDEIDIALDHYKRQHEVPELFKCRLCGILFPRKLDYIRHMRDLHPEAHVYQCPRCPILFKTNTKLKYHLNSHKAKTQELSPDEAGLKTCDLCDQTFCNKETLLRHVARIHPEVARLKYKLLNCPVCEQLFLSKTYLDDHMKQHEPRAQFPCDRCGKAYFCKDSLLTHKRRKH